MEEMRRAGKEQNDRVFQALLRVGTMQNKGKQVNAVFPAGQGSVAVACSAQAPLDGSTSHSARCLGPQAVDIFAFGTERKLRWVAAARAWANMGSFWTSKVMRKYKAKLFKGYVLDAALSAWVERKIPLTDSALSPLQSQRKSRAHGRRLRQGGGLEGGDQCDGAGDGGRRAAVGGVAGAAAAVVAGHAQRRRGLGAALGRLVRLQ